MKKILLLLYIAFFSLSLHGQPFIVVWPDEAGDVKAQIAELLQHQWFHPDEDDIPFYRPEGRDWAYTFHTFSVWDTTHFTTIFPRQYKSYPPFILEKIGYWNLAQIGKDISHSCGRRWRGRRRFGEVLHHLLGSFLEERKQKDGQGNAYSYKGTPLQILWDDPRKMDVVRTYESHPFTERVVVRSSRPSTEDTIFDYSLHKAKWIILGREPVKKNHVLLLLTKELHRLPEE